MGIYESQIIIATVRERPVHGYELGQILYDVLDKQFYELVTRNPHRWDLIRGPTIYKEGRYQATRMFAAGEGMMADVQPIGATITTNNIDGSGTSHAIATGSSTIQNAGLVILRPVGSFTGLTRPNFLPYYLIKNVLPARTSGDLRYYSGWHTTQTSFSIGDDPIAQADGGLVVGFNSTDAKFNIWNGDGTNPITKTELTNVTVSSTIVDYRIEVIFTATSTAVINVYNSSQVLLDTRTINSNLPASAKTLNWSNVIQNPSTTNKSLNVYDVMMRSLR